jgi:DNA invertase Pin-like site-specific DNA recombinase
MTPHSRVALYARVSTANKGQDPDLQLRELREFAASRKWEVVGEVVDKGDSGAKESRPALNRMMADARRRKFDVIAVWKLDRFGRSLKHLVTALSDLESLGLAFVSLRDGFDLTTPSGRAMFGMCAVMAEFERALIRERVKAGMQNAKRKGVRIGRPNRPAFDVDMHAVSARRAAGESLRAIARDLGCSPSLLVKRFKNA